MRTNEEPNLSANYRRLFVIACAGTLCTAHLAAQSYQGGLRGLITDPGAAAIADAKVTLTDQATSIARTTLTTTSGEYVFNAVEPAAYTVAVESPGFKRFERKGVVVATQQFITLDLRLEVGQVNETINVTEELPLIENATASNGQVLDRQKMVDLPNLGRNPIPSLQTRHQRGGRGRPALQSLPGPERPPVRSPSPAVRCAATTTCSTACPSLTSRTAP